MQPNGQILVGGESHVSASDASESDFALIRYNQDGSLDTSFNGTGKIVTKVGSFRDTGRSLGIQDDGKIILAGSDHSRQGSKDFAVARFNSNGSLDTSFGNGGKLTVDVGGSDDAFKVVVQNTGRILLAGFSGNAMNTNLALIRLNSDGTLDETFGNAGKVRTLFLEGSVSLQSQIVAVQNDGSILAAYLLSGAGGYTDFLLARFRSDGSVDTAFGINGRTVTDFDNSDDAPRAITCQSDGKILVAGYSNKGAGPSFDFALARYNPDGSLDLTFNGTGTVVTPVGSSTDYASAVAVQGDQKIVVAGSATNGSDTDFAVVRYLGSSTPEPPIVTAVNPDPVPAINGQQTLRVIGRSFLLNCNVTLRDHRTGIMYPNRTKITESATQIEHFPNFGTPPAEWSVEIVNPDGLSSGQFRFQVGQPVVPGQTISSFEIVDAAIPAPVPPAGMPAPAAAAGISKLLKFRAIVAYLDGSTSDLTDSCEWNVAGDSHAEVDAGSLVLRPGLSATSLNLTARFKGTEAGLTASRTVAVSLPFYVNASDEIDPTLETRVTFRANSGGVNGPAVSYSWTRDGETLGAGQQIQRTMAPGRDYLIGVEGTDSQNLHDSFYFYFSLDRKSAFEPTTSTATAVGGQSLLASNGLPVVLDDPAKKDRGLIVIIHGRSESAASGWPGAMAQAIETTLAGNPPYLLLYDWSEMADPTKFKGGGHGFGTPIEKGAEFVNDIVTIRPYGLAQGKVLADLITNYADSGLVDRQKPVHLIGHSAGGFVAGECGKALRRAGFTGIQVTMLDTPAPESEHFTNPSSGYRLERYVANQYAGAPPDHPPAWYSGLGLDTLNRYNQRFESFVPVYQSAVNGSTPGYSLGEYETRFRIQPSPFYHRFVLDVHSANHLEQHSYAHEWYYQTVFSSPIGGGGGFAYSPFIRTAPFPTASSNGVLPASSVVEPQTQGRGMGLPEGREEAAPVPGFSTFGQVSESGGTFTLTEQENSGLFLDTTLPAEVSAFVFSYNWTSLGDGDFLSVHWNDEPPLAVIPAVGMDAGTSVETEVPLEAFAGRTGRLTIKMVSRNEANAVVDLSGFSFKVSEDPDGDGLSAAEEAARGTDPMKADSDGDGLNDDYEILTTLTNPLAKDTDGDGQGDPNELLAGTDPLSVSSLLRITDFEASAGNSILLKWSSVAGRKYRVRRAHDLSRLDYLTIATGIAGVQSETTITDTAPPMDEKLFFWVEVEPF